MKILITGSSGMLGSDLCRVLSKEHELIGLDSIEASSEYGPENFYEVDISDKKAVKKIFTENKPEIVIHAAAWTDVDGCELDPEKAERINVQGTLNVAECAKDIGAFLIALSTDYVFDGAKRSSYLEEDDTSPISVYGRTKLESENIIKNVLDHYIIVRTSALFGSNGKNFVDTIIKKASEHACLSIVDDQITAPTYTRDLADAILKMVKNKSSFESGIVNICNSGKCSWYEFAVKILEKAQIEKCEIKPIKSDQLERPAKRPHFSVLSNSRFNELTGQELREWEDALADYLSVN